MRSTIFRQARVAVRHIELLPVGEEGAVHLVEQNRGKVRVIDV